jgi:vesicle coat complex subunit
MLRHGIAISKVSLRGSVGAALGSLALAFAATAILGCGAAKEEPVQVRVPALIKALSDPDAGARGRAAAELGRIGPEANEAVPALIKALGETNADVRASAAEALGEIGPQKEEVVPALIAALDDPESFVRASAAWALGNIGPEAGPAAPELKRLTEKDPDESVRRDAREALEKIANGEPAEGGS